MNANNINGNIEIVVKALDAKKAVDIKVLDVSALTTLTDYFVIATGKSNTQVQALCDFVEEKMAEAGKTLINKEGYNSAEWILLGYDDVIVHIFYSETRDFYALEHIWKDAEEVNIDCLLDLD